MSPSPRVVSNHSVLPWITSCLLISLAVIFFKIYNWWRKQRLLVKWSFCRFLVMKQLRRRLWREISVKKGEALTNNIKTTTLPVHHCIFLLHHYHARLFMEGVKTRQRIFLSISEIWSGSLLIQLQDNLPTTANWAFLFSLIFGWLSPSTEKFSKLENRQRSLKQRQFALEVTFKGYKKQV